MDLEEFMEKEGWVKKVYWNDGVPYLAFHKEGFQIDENGISEIDESVEWEDDK